MRKNFFTPNSVDFDNAQYKTSTLLDSANGSKANSRLFMITDISIRNFQHIDSHILSSEAESDEFKIPQHNYIQQKYMLRRSDIIKSFLVKIT